jgi:glutamate carboxypeptidase
MLYEKAKALAAELGYDLPEASTGAISDGNLTAAMGVPTLDGLGPIGDGAHAAHEHICKDQMAKRVALLIRLLEEL